MTKTVLIDLLAQVSHAHMLVEESPKKTHKNLTLYLRKLNRMNWWSCVIEGDPKIDTRKVKPEDSKLSDLDPDVRSTVEEMMVSFGLFPSLSLSCFIPQPQ